jgi:O-acetyl-ADP-ribose deacetylase (regulator of RNase III)
MINYVKGDATSPAGSGLRIIAHVCNDVGGWGAGFVLAISRKWQEPEAAYRSMRSDDLTKALHEQLKTPDVYVEPRSTIYKLGTVQFVSVEDEILVANMIAQRGLGKRNMPAVDYSALKLTLQEVFYQAKKLRASVHMPKIGCGLGGGDWNVVEKIIEETMEDVKTTVYEL